MFFDDPNPMSYFCDTALVLITSSGSSCTTLLNSMSTIIIYTTKPALEYNVIICFRLHANWFAVWVGMNSAIISSIPHPNVTINGKLLTNITSVVSVTHLFFVLSPVGSGQSPSPLALAFDKLSCLSDL